MKHLVFFKLISTFNSSKSPEECHTTINKYFIFIFVNYFLFEVMAANIKVFVCREKNRGDWIATIREQNSKGSE